MVLKIFEPTLDGKDETISFYDNITHATLGYDKENKRTTICVCINNETTVCLPITSVAYLCNDRGQTIEKIKRESFIK